MKLKRFEIEWREIGQEVRKQAKRVMKITRFCYLKIERRWIWRPLRRRQNERAKRCRDSQPDADAK